MYYKDLLITILRLLLIIIGVLIGVAFLTLLERKILGYIQTRKGPNKVGFIGILQPFRDAIKLFTKEQASPTKSNTAPYILSPIIALSLSLIIWSIIPNSIQILNFPLGVIFFIACTRIRVYTLITAGWASNSNYALLGRLRAVSQTISYEIRLALILIFIMILISRLNFNALTKNQEFIWLLIINIPLALIWFSTSLAESNRTPFDFAEGESELVSGFNIEYRRGRFALIFLAEYARILFLRILFTTIFLGGISPYFLFPIKTTTIRFLFIWARATLPRLRYDKLMYLTWRGYLPISLNFIFIAMGLIVFIPLI